MGVATYVFDIPKSIEYRTVNTDTVFDRRIQFMRHVLPRNAKLVDAIEFDHAVGIRFTTKWEHPLFEDGMTIELIQREEIWAGDNGFGEKGSLFLGIKYFRADGTEMFR